MSDTELLDWITATGASVLHKSQPDMGGRDWFVSHPLISSSRRISGRTPREAVELASQRIKEMAEVMKLASPDILKEAAK
jgi:hypothetical protein